MAENPIIPKPPRSTSSPSIDIPETKAAASSQAPADQPTGAKAPHRKKGQESPETKISSPPMETRARKKASGAGGLRGVTGSGQTGSGVDQEGPPPPNLSRNLFP
jgi:hypothetical protein